MSLEDELEGYRTDKSRRRAEWFRYYSEKRLSHQYKQVEMLRDLEVESVLEVGPYLGFVSALLHNAGYKVTGLDIGPALSRIAEVEHVRAEIMQAPADALAGHDVIICCEALEHFEWPEVDALLKRFYEAKPKYLLISVPYAGFQLDWRLYFNAFTLRQKFALKKFASLKRFRKDPTPWGHKWEAGYRGYSLPALEEKLSRVGWRIVRREFTSPGASVFYLLQR